MIFALLFILIGFLLGGIIVSFLDLKNLPKIFASVLVGIIVSCWTVFLPSLIFGSILVGIFVSFILILIFLFVFRRKINYGFKADRLELILIFSIFIFAFFLLTLNLFVEKNNYYYFGTYAWADMPMHMSIINSFSQSDNFPPKYPIYSGFKMGYPFLIDFYSAILNYLGMSLKLSIIIPQILIIVSLFMFFYYLSLKLTNKKVVGIFAILLLMFSGGLGFVNFVINNYHQNPINALFNNDVDYTNNEGMGIQFLNFSNTLVHQRTTTIGYAAILLIFLLIIPKIINKERIENYQLVILGFILGLLVMFHAHSYLGAMGILFLLSLFYKRRDMVYFFVPAITLFLFQLPIMFSQILEGSFVSFHFGWIAPRTFFGFIYFWIMSLGIVLFLFISSFFIIKKQNKILYLTSLSIFLIANIIQFQPWIYDNIKFFRVSLIFVMIGSAESLEYFYSKNKLWKVISILLLITGILSGMLSIISAANHSGLLYSDFDSENSKWIIEHTEKDSVFLTSSKHNHPVPMLTGRAIYRGYGGWLWSHGISDDREVIVKRIYNGELSPDEIRDLEIDYIYISNIERTDGSIKLNENYFQENFEEFYSFDNVKIYSVNRLKR